MFLLLLQDACCWKLRHSTSSLHQNCTTSHRVAETNVKRQAPQAMQAHNSIAPLGPWPQAQDLSGHVGSYLCPAGLSGSSQLADLASS